METNHTLVRQEHLVHLSEQDQIALGEATLTLAMEQARAIAAAAAPRQTSGNIVGRARVTQPGLQLDTAYNDMLARRRADDEHVYHATRDEEDDNK
jgi:hypothetical protein